MKFFLRSAGDQPVEEGAPLFQIASGIPAGIEKGFAGFHCLHIALGVANAGDEGQVELLQEFQHLLRGVGARIDAHADDRNADPILAHGLGFCEFVEEVAAGQHVEAGRRYRYDHAIDLAQELPEGFAMQAGRCVEDAHAAVSGRGAGRSVFRCPGANRRQCAGASLEPFGARLLAVEVGEADNFVAMGKPARQMDRQCRFAAAALGVAYYPAEKKFGADIGAAYVGNNVAGTLGWDFMNKQAQIGVGYANSKRKPAPLPPTPTPPPPPSHGE